MPMEDKRASSPPARTARRGTRACWSRPRRRRTCRTGRRCSTGAARRPEGHPLRAGYPHRYGPQVLPEAAVPGITKVLNEFHDRIADLQRRFLRVIAVRHRLPRDVLRRDARRRAAPDPGHPLPGRWTWPRTRAHVWAGAHGDINLITALPRASAPGLQVQTDDGLDRRRGPRGPGHHQHRDDARAAQQRRHPDRHPPRGGRRPARRATATASSSSATRRRGRSSPRCASCVTPEHPQRYGGIQAGDRLDEVLWEINLVEGGRRVG